MQLHKLSGIKTECGIEKKNTTVKVSVKLNTELASVGFGIHNYS